MGSRGVIGVMGASGGVGTTSVVAGLGSAAVRRGHPVTCLDGQPVGGGLDVVCGADDQPGLRWGQLRRARGELPVEQLLAALPTAGRMRVLTQDRHRPVELTAAAVEAVIGAISRASQLCLVDLPPMWHPGFAAWRGVVSQVLLVCSDDVVGLAAAAAVAPGVKQRVDCPVWLVQRRARCDLAELVARTLELPLAGVVPEDSRVRRELTRGRPPGAVGGPFARACEHILSTIEPGS